MVFRINRFIVFSVLLILILGGIIIIRSSHNEVPVDSAAEFRKIPIIMYHHVTRDKNKANKYTVHIDELNDDLLWIKSNGYETVNISDLIKYASGNLKLPEKPIMITFDDGFESVYVLAYPLLNKYKMKAVVSVIGRQADIYSKNDDHNLNYSNLNWSQIKEMSTSPYVEIQNHTYNMHNNTKGKRKGVSKIKNESDEAYKASILKDIKKQQKLIKTHTGITPSAFVFPYGAYNKDTLDIIKSAGFKCTLTCEEKISTVYSGNPDSLFQLGRFNRPSGITSEAFFNKYISNK